MESPPESRRPNQVMHTFGRSHTTSKTKRAVRTALSTGPAKQEYEQYQIALRRRPGRAPRPMVVGGMMAIVINTMALFTQEVMPVPWR